MSTVQRRKGAGRAPTGRPPGRPTKLTPELQAKVVKLVRAGNYAETAALSVGITVATWTSWCARGREGEEPYAEFLAAIMRARAEAEIALLRRVEEGDPQGTGFGTGRAALTILERTRPKRFAAHVRVHQEELANRFLDIAERALPREHFRALVEAIAVAEGSDEPAGDDPSIVGGGSRPAGAPSH